MPKNNNTYYPLSENRTDSEHYEIRKLIHGEITSVLYVKDIDMAIVMAEDYLWKINKEGHVVDTLRGTSSLCDSGMIYYSAYRPENQNEEMRNREFIDWIYTGNKTEQKVQDIVDAGKMSDNELRDYLDSADIVDFLDLGHDEDHDGSGMAILKTENGWQAMALINRIGEIDSSCREYRRRNKDVMRSTCLEGYERKYDARVSPLNNIIEYGHDWKDKNRFISINKFRRKFYYFEEGFFLWLLGNTLLRILKNVSNLPGSLPSSYWFGTGYTQLRHHSEQLNFKSFISNEDGEITFDTIAVYNFADKSDADTRFIEIMYAGGEHSYSDKLKRISSRQDKDVGLYVLRKKENKGINKSNHKIIPGQSTTYYIRNTWRPVFNGMEAHESISGDIGFINTAEKSHHYLLHASVATTTELHAIPKKISFDWSVKYPRYAFKLHLNDSHFAWFLMPDNCSLLYLEVIFDEKEIVAAFEKLSRKKGPLQLEIHLDEIENIGATLSIQLRNGKEVVSIKNSTFIAVDKNIDTADAEDIENYERARLRIEQGCASADQSKLADFFKLSSDIAKNSKLSNKLADALTAYTNELINNYSGQGGCETAKKVINYYLDNVHPSLVALDCSEDVLINFEIIASNSLAIALQTNDAVMRDRVLNELLGGEFEITSLKNATLLLNLACYYSRQNNKEQMLIAIKESIHREKEPGDFLADKDFEEYWSDADFLGILADATPNHKE